MSKNFVALASFPFKSGAGICRPTQVMPHSVTLDDQAVNVMTDLRKVSVVNVRAKTSLDKANDKMIRYGVLPPTFDAAKDPLDYTYSVPAAAAGARVTVPGHWKP